MSLAKMPNELLDGVLGFLGRDDLVSVRTVSHRWSRIATRHLFYTVTLRPSIEGFNNWYACFANPDIKTAARRLVIHTTDNGVNGLGAGLQKFEPHRAEPGTTETTRPRPLSLIAEFPRVTELCVVFSDYCLSRRSQVLQQDYSLEAVDMREEALQDILSALFERHAKPGVPKITRLEMQNMQNVVLPDITASQVFTSAIQHVEHLDLHMIIEKSLAHGLYYEMAFPERWTFDEHLLTSWVAPLAHQLKSLSLGYSSWGFWGSIPGQFDPSGVEFPCLESLTLREYAIAHHDDLDWVLALPSLKKLALEDCRIVSNVWVGDRDRPEWNLDTHDWIREPPEMYHFDVENASHPEELYQFPGTWEDMLDKIRLRLPGLGEFKFCIPWGQRYIVFEDGRWPTPWILMNNKGDMEFGDGQGVKKRDIVNRAKETNKGDRRALAELQQAVSGAGLQSRRKGMWLVRIPGRAIGVALRKHCSGVVEFWGSPSRWLRRRLMCPVSGA